MKVISIVKETGEIIGITESGVPLIIQDEIQLHSGDRLEIVSNVRSNYVHNFIASDEIVSGSCEGCVFSKTLYEYEKYEINCGERLNICSKLCLSINNYINRIIFTNKFYESSGITVKEDRIREVLCNEDTCPYYMENLNCQSLDGIKCLYMEILR